jgi:hypothetical protein
MPAFRALHLLAKVLLRNLQLTLATRTRNHLGHAAPLCGFPAIFRKHRFSTSLAKISKEYKSLRLNFVVEASKPMGSALKAISSPKASHLALGVKKPR